jgi:hypothetical protein
LRRLLVPCCCTVCFMHWRLGPTLDTHRCCCCAWPRPPAPCQAALGAVAVYLELQAAPAAAAAAEEAAEAQLAAMSPEERKKEKLRRKKVSELSRRGRQGGCGDGSAQGL